MKLHLPKILLGAVLAACMGGSYVSGMSVTYDYSSGTEVAISTNENYQGCAVSYSQQTGVLTGAQYTAGISFDLSMGWDKTADDVTYSDTTLIIVQNGDTKWGFMTSAGDNLVEQWGSGKWTDTGKGAKDIPITGTDSVKLTAQIDNSGTRLKYAGSETWDLFENTGLVASSTTINSYYINKENISKVYVKDAGATFTSADGQWSQTYAAGEAMYVTNKRQQINGGIDKTNDANTGAVPANKLAADKTIVVGNGGQLFLQGWNTGAFNLNNDIVLGTGGNQDGYGALRFGNDGGFTTTLNGSITVVEDTKMRAGGTNAVNLNGKISGANHKLTVVGASYTFGETVELGTLELSNVESGKPSTMIFNKAVDVDALVVGGNTTATFNGAVTIGSAIANSGVINLNAGLIIEDLSGFNYTVLDSESQTENGLIQMGKAYTIWNGTANAGSTKQVTYNGNSYNINDNGTFTIGQSAYLVAKDTVYVGGESPTDDTKSATLFLVREGAVLELGAREEGAALTPAQILSTTEGSGTINLKTNATLSDGSSTVFGGTVKISQGATLYLGSDSEVAATHAWTADVSSLKEFELAGGKLQFRGGSISLGDIKVSADSTLSLYDQDSTSSLINIGTLTLNAKLDLANRWKTNTAIEKLTGSGNLAFGDVATEDGSNHRYVHIKSMQGYTGTLTFVGNEKHEQQLKLGIHNTAMGDTFSTGIISAGDNTKVVIDGGAGGATVAADAQQMTELQLGNNTNVTMVDGSYNFKKLSLNTGATATLQHEWNKNQYIDALVGEDAELVLKHTRQEGYSAHTHAAAYVLNGSGSTNYSGIINLQNYANDNQSGLIVKSDESGTKLADTVVKFTGDHKAILAFVNDDFTLNQSQTLVAPTEAQRTDGAVAGLQGDNGNVYAAQLTVNVADNKEYSYGGGLYAASLVKDGKGKQTFSGDLSTFNGALTVNAGELALTATETLNVTNLTVAEAGTLTVSKDTVGGSIKITGAVTLNGGATVNAALVDLSEASSLYFNVGSDGSAISLNGALTMGSTESFVLALGDSLTNLSEGETLTIFTGVNSFTVGGVTYTAESVDQLTNVDLSTWSGDVAVGQYTLTYDTTANAGSISITAGAAIPEPTTATLSLLALAGLCARRRRR